MDRLLEKELGDAASRSTGIGAALDDTLSRIFPHLIFEKPSNIVFLETLKERGEYDLYKKIFDEYKVMKGGDSWEFDDYILQNTLQPLFYSEKQRQTNIDNTQETHHFQVVCRSGVKRAIGYKGDVTQIGGEPDREEYDDIQFLGFGLPLF